MSGIDAATVASASLAGDWAELLFEELGAAIEAEQSQRDSVLAACGAIETAVRALRPKVAAASKAYRLTGTTSGDAASADRVQHLFAGVVERLRELDRLLSRDTYWKFHHMWRAHLQTLVCMVACITFFASKTIATPGHVTSVLGLGSCATLSLEVDDYLIGLCDMSNELVRLAVVSVIDEQYEWPVAIRAFLDSVYSAFRILNLKNDVLRRRFDSLKWDVKKCEDIVFDLQVRGLGKAGATGQ